MNHMKYSVIFHYNTYRKKWYCIPKELFVSYFNGKKREVYGRGSTTDKAYENYLEKT